MSRPFTKPVDICATLTRKPPKLDHVLPGLLLGTVGMVAGPGGIGKTTLELQIAVALATGTPLPWGLTQSSDALDAHPPAKVVLVTPEESEAVLAHKLHALAKSLLRPVCEGGTGLPPSVFLERLAKNLTLFGEHDAGSALLLDARGRVSPSARGLLRAARGARLVILDPLRQFHAGEENDSGAMNRAVVLLRALAKRSGAAVVVAHHTSRAAAHMGFGDTAGASRGSTALPDGIRWQLNLSQPTREWAKAHGLDASQRHEHLLLDISKANYSSRPATLVLRRASGGLLEWAPNLGGSMTGAAPHTRRTPERRAA